MTSINGVRCCKAWKRIPHQLNAPIIFNSSSSGTSLYDSTCSPGANNLAYSQYKEIDLAARTAAASPLELVLVLFSGLMDELERAKSHIEGRRFEKKAQSINKCIDILNALTSSLEFETGGELVVNLSRLYDHCVYRLYEASGELSAEKIDEVMLILSNLREGWEGLSGKLG